MSKDRCENWATMQDFVDGLLPQDEERRLRGHLAACDICRREEAELRRLHARVAELPREISPPRDLWPAVAGRIGERGDASVTDPEAGSARRGPWRRRRRRGWTAGQWARQAAAAVVFMALGALLARLATPAGRPDGRAVRHGDVPRTAVASPASARAVGFDEIEAEYLRAKEALWLVVYSRHEELSPVTLEIVRRNLVIVDDAIRDLRAALAEDPGNRQLATSLLAQHRRSIHLLQRLTRGRPAEL